LPHLSDHVRNKLTAGENAFGDDFRRGAGCRGPHVSDKIADGEIDFVPDG
jgi:hypothetical protein